MSYQLEDHGFDKGDLGRFDAAIDLLDDLESAPKKYKLTEARDALAFLREQLSPSGER